MLLFDVYKELQQDFPDYDITLANHFWEELTSVKMLKEIELIRKAVNIASKGIQKAMSVVKPRIKELNLTNIFQLLIIIYKSYYIFYKL